MDGLSEYSTAVIRLFPDYAESAIWFAIGVVRYEDAHLSPELQEDMKSWEASFYADLDTFNGWRSPESAESFAKNGLLLAGRLADELGKDFEVEVDADVAGRRMRRFRSDSVATNLSAAKAFRAIADRSKAEHDSIQKRIAEGHTYRWAAHPSELAPGSD
jgi:hypothetical protein